MPSDLLYPTAAELTQIDAEYFGVQRAADPIFSVFPYQEEDSDIITWEQRDNYQGLQQIRGLNGQPLSVKRVGSRRLQAEPGFYGEFIPLDEMEITRRRSYGNPTTPIPVDDLVMEADEQLIIRQTNRMRKVCWDLLIYGVFSVLDVRGAIMHTDAYKQRLFSSTVAWSTPATSTPIADFRSVQLMSRGYSVNFGPGATAYMNQQTFNYYIGNTNPVDLGGVDDSGLQTIVGLDAANRMQSKNGLPMLAVWDEGYLDDTGTFQVMIPDNYVVVVGRRNNGAALGQFRVTRNATNPNSAPGPYAMVWDSQVANMPPPRRVEVHRGLNGGPLIWYPSAVVVMKVG